MTLKDDGDIKNKSYQEYMSENDGCSSDEKPYEGDLLVVRCHMSAFIEDDQTQRENIFHSRCMVKGNYYLFIVDGNSNVNVASLRLALIEIILGKYKDEILCNIVPVEATDILLRRPWQFDKKVTHDSVTNKFSFEHKGKKVTIKPLSPHKVIEDQIKMKK
ncbi:hypothetical protein CR513_33120, partial [Mucuna pruriens]